MTNRALPRIFVAEIHWMLEYPVRRLDRFALESLIDRRMTNRAFISYNLAFLAEMLAIMASETSLGIVVPDIICVCSPVRLHLREEVGLVDPLQFRHRTADCISL